MTSLYIRRSGGFRQLLLLSTRLTGHVERLFSTDRQANTAPLARAPSAKIGRYGQSTAAYIRPIEVGSVGKRKKFVASETMTAETMERFQIPIAALDGLLGTAIDHASVCNPLAKKSLEKGRVMGQTQTEHCFAAMLCSGLMAGATPSKATTPRTPGLQRLRLKQGNMRQVLSALAIDWVGTGRLIGPAAVH